MLEHFRFWPLRRRGWLALPLAVLLAPAALAQCPIAANCTPGPPTDPNAGLFGRGITRVTLNTLNFTTPINDGGYHDYCSTSGTTTLFVGASYPLTVTTAPGGAEIVRVWADFDNNGIFNPTTELVLASTATGVHSGTLTVPATAALNAPLRLRVASDDAASTIRTPCAAPEYSETEDYAFTVQTNTAPPTASFTAGADTVTCSGLVQFTDLTAGAPSTWRWRFGDGQTSTQQNPLHPYAALGRYSVTLTVTNVNGSDSLTRTRYIRYDAQVPVAASCTPQTLAYCCGYGISRVRLGSLDRASANAGAGYEDFTCGVRATLVSGNRYPLRIALAGTQAQDVRAWLDLNNDGQFAASEQILTALSQTDSVTTMLLIPAGAPLNTPLRLRVAADAAGQAGGPCVGPQLGQMEDYTVVVRTNTLPPMAEFSVSPLAPCDTVKFFTDLSQSAPTSWLWRFGDGQTSTQQNPTHTYRSSGLFTVTLRVTNAFGTDSLTTVGAAIVTTPCRNYCVPSGLQTQSVWISRVQVAQIDRTSGLDPNAYAVTYNPPARLLQGQNTLLNVTTAITGGGMGGPPQFTTAVWIDWNQNGTWDAAERVMQLQGDPNNNILTQAVAVPALAPPGLTMMRVMSTRNPQLANDPCPPTGARGVEVEDYLILVSTQQAPPVADFVAADTVSCNGLIQFTDLSQNGPTSWLWRFGDGQTSTLQNPLHQYPTTVGTYTARVQATNQYGTDSTQRTVRVTGGPVPIAPSCRPESATPGFNLGIDSVRLTAFGRVLTNSTPNGADGYRDYTCGRYGVVFRGKVATIQVRTIQPMGARVLAWIDYDNNGEFQLNTERIINSNAPVNGTHVATFTVPTTALLNTPLRLRVGSDWTNNNPLRPCGTQGGMTPQPQYGQFEDYTVFVRDTVLAVGADRAPLALSVLPNPTADGRVTVRFGGDAAGRPAGGLLTLTVRSVLGQVVARRTLPVLPGTEAALDLSALPRGVYSVQTDGPTPALRGTLRLLRD